jgi:hypothetical protein
MRMSDASKLFVVRLVHTIIYAINAGACFVVLNAGLTGHIDPLFWFSAVLVAVEAAILLANGLKCPMSPLAVKYGARETDFFYDTFLPERLTRHTFHFFSIVVLLGLVFIGLRWAGVIV